ncbi:MAG TPA: alpha/beta hydrolase [Tenuifilaceae bacterium]|nr:alpha/beta hydrolase [Tenuifilaceae bacterium]HPE19364.1 alpha/beta hydrolase [Tenuifilaceae bacterium]HPJ47085.1 alpha/beta hydrolase [Tenuifilaceae bacterium]HPQ34196.1 alpha/beta hydrolase [Tenuifilaceae bacterium]HRX67869.1 alpha/beta hydrolase [Tenuifilaceae bacterium]
MASFKSKVFNFMMRNRHLMMGKLRKEVFDDNTSIEAFRETCEAGANRYAKIPEGIEVKPQVVNGVNSEWLIPQGSNPEKVIMYVHGGGYVSGSCNDHRGFVSKFAKNTGVKNLVYEYGLAPEKPFPAAVNDSLLVYRWILENGFKPENILLAGESAGGGLALAILLALKEQKIPFPCGAVAISPWTDLTCSSDSYKTKNKYSVAPLNSWYVFSKNYVGNSNPELPLISPLFGDLAGLPPILINSGEDDELYEDGEKFYIKAKQAGVDISFRKGEGMVHCYPLLSPMFPEAKEAMDEIVEFARNRLKVD